MNEATIDALRAGYEACLAMFESSESVTRTLKVAAAEKVNDFAQRFIQEYRPDDKCTKVGRYITDELRSSVSKGDFSGRIPVTIFGLSAIRMTPDELQPIVEIMNAAGIRASTFNAPKAVVIEFNLQDASDETEKDNMLIADIEAAANEVGVAIPGIDSIINKIKTGRAHWSSGETGIVIPNNEYIVRKDAFSMLFQAASRHGLKIATSPCKYGTFLTVSW